MALIRRDSPYPHWEWTDPAGGELLRVVPERGGLVTGWRTGDREVLYFDAERFADPSKSVRGGIPVLFPICGGLPDSPLPQHGFARDQSWRLSELAEGSGVQLELSDSPATLALYPYAFGLSLELRPQPGALAISALIENRSTEPMPFSLGLHPYFNVSDLAAVRFEGLPERCFNHLTMAEDSTAAQLGRLAEGVDLLVRPEDGTGWAQPIRLIDGGLQGKGGHGDQPVSTISLKTNHPLDLVVLWSDPPRPMVCLEPWSGPRLALISGDRRLVLAPGANMALHTRYELS